jgi:hypothetical protein
LELGVLAYHRRLISRSDVSLAHLSEALLGLGLSKDPKVRATDAWKRLPLPDVQLAYAALDVYTTWKIFKTIQRLSGGDTSLDKGVMLRIVEVDDLPDINLDKIFDNVQADPSIQSSELIETLNPQIRLLIRSKKTAEIV